MFREAVLYRTASLAKKQQIRIFKIIQNARKKTLKTGRSDFELIAFQISEFVGISIKQNQNFDRVFPEPTDKC